MSLTQRIDRLERQVDPGAGGLYLFHDNGDGTCLVGGKTMTAERYRQWRERMGDRVTLLTLDGLFGDEGADHEPETAD